jgi:hypothetical protein
MLSSMAKKISQGYEKVRKWNRQKRTTDRHDRENGIWWAIQGERMRGCRLFMIISTKEDRYAMMQSDCCFVPSKTRHIRNKVLTLRVSPVCTGGNQQNNKKEEKYDAIITMMILRYHFLSIKNGSCPREIKPSVKVPSSHLLMQGQQHQEDNNESPRVIKNR